jgi:hypothetical protein
LEGSSAGARPETAPTTHPNPGIHEENAMRTTIAASTLTLGLWLATATAGLAAYDPAFRGGVYVATGDVNEGRSAVLQFAMMDGSVRSVSPGPFTIRFETVAGKLVGDVAQSGRPVHDDVPFAIEGACNRIYRDGGEGNDLLIGGDGYDVLSGQDGSDLLIWDNGDGSDIELSAWDGARATFRATGGESGEIRAAHPDDPGCVLVGRIAP